MDDIDDNLDEQEEEKKKKKKKGEDDAAGRSEVTVTEGFYAHMASVGASKSLVAEILGSWRHLRGDALFRALRDFFRNFTRATAHAEVDIDKSKDFSLLHNLVQLFRKDPAQKPSAQQKASMQNKMDPK